jgi:hypothetical protein
MCDGILVKGPDGHSFCIPIVQYPISWPPHRPDPERFHQVIEDITTIATISQAITRLNNADLRGQVGQAMQAALKTAAHHLPAGVTVGDGLLKLPQRG